MNWLQRTKDAQKKTAALFSDMQHISRYGPEQLCTNIKFCFKTFVEWPFISCIQVVIIITLIIIIIMIIIIMIIIIIINNNFNNVSFLNI